MSDKVINFYRERDEYGCFSNFSDHSFVIDGVTWPTSEHYFQAKKFEGSKWEEYIRKVPTPADSAKEGRDHSKPLRKDWEDVKEKVMYTAIHAKFTQNEDIYNILMKTGDAKLVEHTRNDKYWGDGGDGSGKNRLGINLMLLRDDFRQNKK
jgi:ribA/ribD-fused uncharacterized protein